MANGKKTMVQFTAAWIPGEGEKDDANCAVTGVIQLDGETPTSLPAHLMVRDYLEDKPCWWPAVTLPAKKQLSYGQAFADEEPIGTDLHQVKVAKGTVFQIKAKDGSVARYSITKVEDLTA